MHHTLYQLFQLWFLSLLSQELSCHKSWSWGTLKFSVKEHMPQDVRNPVPQPLIRTCRLRFEASHCFQISSEWEHFEVASARPSLPSQTRTHPQWAESDWRSTCINSYLSLQDKYQHGNVCILRLDKCRRTEVTKTYVWQEELHCCAGYTQVDQLCEGKLTSVDISLFFTGFHRKA